MPAVNGSIVKERPTSTGAILTVTLPHGTYEVMRDRGKITSAAYRQGDSKATNLKNTLEGHNKQEQKKSEEKKKSLWTKAGDWLEAISDPEKRESFLRAVKSKALEGPVSLQVLNHRHQCCFGSTLEGQKVSEPCSALMESESHHYCKSCGCGQWKLARLDAPADSPQKSKLAFPDLTCPLGRWSAMRGMNAAN